MSMVLPWVKKFQWQQPKQKTCADCKHFELCKKLGNCTTGDEVLCHWHPSRFTPRNRQHQEDDEE